GAADVALVEEDAVDDAFDRLIDRGVIENDIGGFPAELQRVALLRSRERLLDNLADLGAPGEGNLVDIGMVYQSRAGLAGAGDDVDDTRREIAIGDDLGELHRSERRCLG